MATYRFETMSQADATGFANGDTLIFTAGEATPAGVTVTEGDTTTSLTSGGKTLIFAQAALVETPIQFSSAFETGSDAQLVLGSSLADDVDSQFGADGSYAYGLSGNDTIDATGGTGADWLFGGDGGDTISGGAGNDHIYGFGLTGALADDGDDSVLGGAGNDYIQGNAGKDTLDGGTENDRINGGGGDDSILGGAGIDTINGNKGEDIIDGGAGNDIIRGGQDDDTILGNTGNDIISGDLGDDTITGGAGLDVLTGADGADVFVFAASDASYSLVAPNANLTDVVTDMASGDKLDIGLTLSDIEFVGTGVTYTTFAAAEAGAQAAYDTGGNDQTVVYAYQVGADTYVFYDGGTAGTDIDSAIKLVGIDADTFFDAGAPNGRFD